MFVQFHVSRFAAPAPRLGGARGRGGWGAGAVGAPGGLGERRRSCGSGRDGPAPTLSYGLEYLVCGAGGRRVARRDGATA